jgi:hypothetical protein
MSESQKQWLVADISKYGRQIARGFVTAREYADKVFDLWADSDRLYPEIIPALWQSIPESVRSDFTAALRVSVLPDFRWHAFEIGGSRGLTEDERRIQADRNTKRVQAWALGFLRFLDSQAPATIMNQEN